MSNLYGQMENLKIRLEHNVKNDPYTFKKSTKIIDRDNFYQQAKQVPRRNDPMEKTIHQKMNPPADDKQDRAPEIPFIKKEDKVSLRENKEYIHKVMAPAFLTDD